MRAIILLLAAALCCGSVHAQLPRKINYQGYLTSPVGTPVNATVSMALKLYNVVTGGAALYTETQSVTVTNGVFNVLIGSVTTLALPFDVPYYLGITINPDPEMTPREELVASPYAIRAASAEALAPTATVPGSQISGALSSATLPAAALTGTVTGSQLASGLTLGGTTAGSFSGPLTGNVAGNVTGSLTGNVTGNVSGSAASFTGALAGDVTGTQGATAIAASTVTGKALTGFASGAGAISASDTLLTAINKLDGNVALKAPLASPTFTGTANAANLTVSNTLLAGSVGIPTASTSPVLPTKLNVVANSPKATVATTRGMAVTTNDAANPFALDVKIVGAAALPDRRVILQTTDWNLAGGGGILLQPAGGNVGVGPNITTAMLAVAGVIESTSGGVKYPDGNTQTKALANCSAEGDVAVMRLGVWVCRSALGYVDNGDGTVTDNKTGLMWEKKVACAVADATQPNCILNTYTWSAALPFTEPTGTLYSDFVERLNDLKTPGDGTATPCFAGYCDWRIPTIGELRSILAAPFPTCATSPCIDAIFGPTAASFYWSSSSLASGTIFAWLVDFYNGSVNSGVKNINFHTRAVRSGR